MVHAIGVLALRTESYEEALRRFEDSAGIAPSEPAFHNSLGVACEKLGKPNDAVAHFERAVQLSPDYATAWHNLGNLNKDLVRIESAIACYDRVLEFARQLFVRKAQSAPRSVLEVAIARRAAAGSLSARHPALQPSDGDDHRRASVASGGAARTGVRSRLRREARQLHGHRRRHRQLEFGHHGGYGGGTPSGRSGCIGLGPAPPSAGLALDARFQDHALVPHDETVPPKRDVRVGRTHCGDCQRARGTPAVGAGSESDFTTARSALDALERNRSGDLRWRVRRQVDDPQDQEAEDLRSGEGGQRPARA
ncbi:MAG TPA: tetratricopeptide repeat protein [Gemmatimonadetes bacterium]|nr:tetratricopeptide repeat protein [Gemmatimonadota bacterium]